MGKVFISYSHDSKEHAEKVLSVAKLLRKDGIDCVLDQYSPHPAEGWPRWMENNINAVEFVLIIYTQTYYNRVMGLEKKGTGLGVKWEGNLINNKIYNNDSVNNKFIPLLFKPEDKQYIPGPLAGSTFYLITNKDEYVQLYRRLTHQPEIKKPEPGEIKSLGTKQIPDFFSTTKDSKQPGSITKWKLRCSLTEFIGKMKSILFINSGHLAPIFPVCLIFLKSHGTSLLPA